MIVNTMLHKIPGGRQRANSESDVLDDKSSGVYGSVTSYPNNEQSLMYGNSCTRNTLANYNYANPRKINNNLNVNEHDGISESGSYSSKGHNSKSLKSVKNSMKKMVKQAFSHHGVQPHEHDRSKVVPEKYNISALVTPTFGRRLVRKERVISETHENQENKVNGDAAVKNNSTSRPLITESVPNIVHNGGLPSGIIGLRNHGNTCFMNAVLQCLSNTDSLTGYFVTDKYRKDINNANNRTISKKSPLKGEVTEQLAKLIKSVWQNKYHPDVSNQFKTVVGFNNRQYEGNCQHDAQEFLLWLLDKVHEDLVVYTGTKKKIKAHKNVSSRPDCEMANEVMTQNRSFVYNLFQVLYRSSLECPHCHRHSNTFDPDLCISLPLPQKSLRAIYAVVVFNEQAQMRSRQLKIGLRLNTYDSLRELRLALAKETDIDENRLLLVQLYDDGFYNTFADTQPLSDIAESEVVYALESPPHVRSGPYQPSFVTVAFVNVEKVTSPSRSYRFGSPEVVEIERDVSFDELQKCLLQHMRTTVTIDRNTEVTPELFHVRVVGGIHGRHSYLTADVEMPLYTEAVDKALAFHDLDQGPQVLKLVLEWDSPTKECAILSYNDDLEEDATVHHVRLSQQQAPHASLHECFQLYTQEEKLSGDDAWLCPYCKKQQQGTIKKLGLWSLPDVFVVHLKRFRQVGQRRTKLNTLVTFPVSGLDMNKHLIQTTSINNNRSNGQQDEDNLYDLYAVCNHYGNMAGGHYTAFCQNPVDHHWYAFDDSRVESLSADQVISHNAYLLFYQRRSVTQQAIHDLDQGEHWVLQLTKEAQVVQPPPSPKKTKSWLSFSPRGGRKKFGASMSDLPSTPTSRATDRTQTISPRSEPATSPPSHDFHTASRVRMPHSPRPHRQLSYSNAVYSPGSSISNSESAEQLPLTVELPRQHCASKPPVPSLASSHPVHRQNSLSSCYVYTQQTQASNSHTAMTLTRQPQPAPMQTINHQAAPKQDSNSQAMLSQNSNHYPKQISNPSTPSTLIRNPQTAARQTTSPHIAQTETSNPHTTQTQTGNPFRTQTSNLHTTQTSNLHTAQNSNPFRAQTQTSNLHTTQTSNPHTAQTQTGNPFITQTQPSNPHIAPTQSQFSGPHSPDYARSPEPTSNVSVPATSRSQTPLEFSSDGSPRLERFHSNSWTRTSLTKTQSTGYNNQYSRHSPMHRRSSHDCVEAVYSNDSSPDVGIHSSMNGSNGDRYHVTCSPQPIGSSNQLRYQVTCSPQPDDSFIAAVENNHVFNYASSRAPSEESYQTRFRDPTLPPRSQSDYTVHTEDMIANKIDLQSKEHRSCFPSAESTLVTTQRHPPSRKPPALPNYKSCHAADRYRSRVAHSRSDTQSLDRFTGGQSNNSKMQTQKTTYPTVTDKLMGQQRYQPQKQYLYNTKPHGSGRSARAAVDKSCLKESSV